jgi:two-component system phosphate regulon sensor histidine kinase PhoR
MASTNQILIYSSPGAELIVDHSVLLASGYDVVTVSQPQAAESWLSTFLADDLLIIVNPSVPDALNYSREILEIHPCLPIILVSSQPTISILEQALKIGLFDYLTYPVDSSTLLLSVKSSLVRQNNWQEWNRFTRVLAELEDGILLVGLDGNLIMMNQSARNILSVKENHIIGMSIREVVHHTDILDIFKSQGTLPRLCEINLEDGRIFNAQASLIPQIGTAVVLQDITPLKELDRIKTEFVNTVSHDLRSPLTSIYGFVSLIDRVGTINEQQADFIRHIQSSVQHITSLITDLMDLGRVEADYDIQMQDVNLNEIISQSIKYLDYQVSEKMQELVLSIPDHVPDILGNPLHLQRMISNLLENAIKFTPTLGKINILCRVETNQLILEISDNGPGIPLDDQPHIFDKFYRGSNLSQNIPGTGLGLSIVKSVVDKHHGRIWLDSSPAGTTFTVLLPVK